MAEGNWTAAESAVDEAVKEVKTEDAIVEEAIKHLNKDVVGDGSVEHADHRPIKEASDQ